MAASWPLAQAYSGIESTYNIGTGTDVRDVSDILDAVYLADTPFVNKIGWGEPATNRTIEWITDNIGPGYVITSAAIASDASAIVVASNAAYGAASIGVLQIHTGTVLWAKSSEGATEGYLIVEDPQAGAGNGSMAFCFVDGTTTSFAADTTLFIVGSPVGEGSTARVDTTRPRAVCTNRTQIFRQDVSITGSRQAVQMYGVADELRKQIELRTKEMMREIERTALLGFYQAGVAGAVATGVIQCMGGVSYFLSSDAGTSGDHIDTSTTTLTETAINNVAAEVYNRGGSPDVLVIGPAQARVIPTFERSRVRVEQDARLAGFYVNKYLTDLGVTLDILVDRFLPKNFAFVLSSEKIKLRPLKGRKLLLEKLGRRGDYQEWQLISELSLEMKGYNLGQHGAFTALT